MTSEFQPPKRTGLLSFFRSSVGCQFVIPVYQRNYTWTAGKEVKQLLDDLANVLSGEYKNHFIGIMIYLEKTIDHSAREFLVIDGQQRLTTTFLILYAIKSLHKEKGDNAQIDSLQGQYLINPFSPPNLKHKLKPLVADDEVYQLIVNDELHSVTNKDSNVFKNYNYIFGHLKDLNKIYTIDQILDALDKLYIVCVPLSDNDNPQKIFESINATGVKLTASDLIRNYLLMDMTSEDQEHYYAKYWKHLEQLLTSDAKKLEAFFRFFLAVQNKTLPNKNAVYDVFVKWHKDICRELETEEVFQLIAAYADYYFAIYKQDLSTIDSSIRNPLKEFRRILSDMPAPLLMELYRLYKLESISGPQLAEMLTIVNSYLQRRALCDLDTSSISRLFPALLRDILVECDGDFTNIVEVLKKNLIVKNAGNSMYMPNDVQLAELIDNANMYNIHATRLFLDKLEHHNNNAPVDLNSLSIEHIMPQTPTSEWYQALNIDEDTYQRNVHRLGNLTLASKRDNSAMGNGVWAYKNAILADTAHLKINEELLKIAKWTIAEIDNRTKHLIEKIKQLYPYPNVSPDVISRVQVYIRKNNVQAKGFLSMDNGSVEVEVGSQLRRIENAELYAEVEDLRQELLEEGVIAQTEDGLSFIKPYIFYSKATNHTALSPTASLIMHGSQNGWEEWVDSSGTPLCNIKEIRSMFS